MNTHKWHRSYPESISGRQWPASSRDREGLECVCLTIMVNGSKTANVMVVANVVTVETTTMNEDMPNPTIEGYKTAHRQNKDGSYHFTVMKSDIGCQKLTESKYNEKANYDKKNNTGHD